MRSASLGLPLVIVALPAAALAEQVVFSNADSIALDQPRVAISFTDAGGNEIPGGGVGYTFLADTGATGILVAQGGHFDWDALETNPNLYTNVAQYLEQGVGGFDLVGLSAPYTTTISAYGGFSSPPPGDVGTHQEPGSVLLTAPNLNIGSFDGIMGMPGLDNKVTIVNLASLTNPDSDLGIDFIGTGFANSVPTAPAEAPTHTFSLSPLHFDPRAGSLNESDPTPTHSPLPTLGVTAGVSGASGGGSFLLDTGAQLSMISGDVARSLGLNLDIESPDTDIVDELPVGGVGGETTIPVVMVDSFTLTSDEGVDLVFENLAVGVLDIPGLPVAGILGFNPFTTGYLAPVLAALEDPTDPAAALDGAFLDIVFDFTQSDAWTMRLTQNPHYVDPPAGTDLFDQSQWGLENEVLFAWPAVSVPEPATATLLAGLGLAALGRRRAA